MLSNGNVRQVDEPDKALLAFAGLLVIRPDYLGYGSGSEQLKVGAVYRLCQLSTVYNGLSVVKIVKHTGSVKRLDGMVLEYDGRNGVKFVVFRNRRTLTVQGV